MLKTGVNIGKMALFAPRQPPRPSRICSTSRTSWSRRGSCQVASGHRPSSCSGQSAPQQLACARRPSSNQLHRHVCTDDSLRPPAFGAAKHACTTLEEAGRHLEERAAVLLGPWHPQLQELQQLLVSQMQLLQARREDFPVIKACFEAWAKRALHARSHRERGAATAPIENKRKSCESSCSAAASAVLLQRCLGRWREALVMEKGERLEGKAALQRQLRQLRETRGLHSAGNLAWAAFRLWVRGASARRLEAARKELAQWKQRAETLDAEIAGHRRAHVEAVTAMAEQLCQMRRGGSSSNSSIDGSSGCGGSTPPCLRCYFHAWKGEVATPTQLPATPFLVNPADFFEGCLPSCQLSAVQVMPGEDSEAERSLLEEHLASNERCLRVLEAWAEGLEASLLRACLRSWAAASRHARGNMIIQVCDRMLVSCTRQLKASFLRCRFLSAFATSCMTAWALAVCRRSFSCVSQGDIHKDQFRMRKHCTLVQECFNAW